MELRVLVHAPRGRDAAVVQGVLERHHQVRICDGAQCLLACLDEGAAAAIVTEEALSEGTLVEQLSQWLRVQPSWSDFPFIVLATRQPGPRSSAAVAMLRALGNVILLERPLNAETLASANDRLMKEISERERAQAALTQVQKLEAIGRLTGGIAHDFNNLLHVVNMNLELVSMYAKEEKVKPVVERAKSAAKRGSKLTSQLLSFARNQSLLPRLTHVNKLLLGMKDLLEISAGPGVEIVFDLCEAPAPVLLDSSQLEMAVLNLAVNSRDAMPEGGVLTISTAALDREAPEGELKAGEYVVVRVADTGKGIPPPLLAKVFDPFFTTKPVGSGTGLGLSQVYGFARQSGGLAFIQSAPGTGTAVEMHFPIASIDVLESMGTETTLPLEARRPVKPHKILVVEDDAEVRRVIVECLGLIGYTVTEAANGAEGLEAICRDKPDLLMVDYAMPDMTGAEVISRAREMVGDLPVILATGYADMAAVERLAGKPAILRKPFDINTLGKTVASVLDAVPESAGVDAGA